MNARTLSPLGRFLRKLRIDRNELLKTMADKLSVSSAFLSAVEMGRKHVPEGWEQTLSDDYHLDAAQRTELSNAIAESAKSVRLDLTNISADSRRTVLAFARKIQEVDEADLERIAEFLKGMKK